MRMGPGRSSPAWVWPQLLGPQPLHFLRARSAHATLISPAPKAIGCPFLSPPFLTCSCPWGGAKWGLSC